MFAFKLEDALNALHAVLNAYLFSTKAFNT